MRADGGDVLERMIRLPGMKGTVYSLLGKVSEQSGYLFVYDSKVVNNDIEVKTKRKNCTVRQAIYEIIGDRSLELKVIGHHILIQLMVSAGGRSYSGENRQQVVFHKIKLGPFKGQKQIEKGINSVHSSSFNPAQRLPSPGDY